MASQEHHANWSKVDQLMQAAAVPFAPGKTPTSVPSGNVFPGAVLLVGRAGEVVYHKSFGCRSLIPEPSEMSTSLVFDVASLTKAVVTTTLVMQLVERGQLQLDRRLSTILQTFGTHGKERITIRHLLSHCSGYPAYMPFYKRISKAESDGRMGMMSSRGAVDLVLQEIFRGTLENLPGKVGKYSDIGFILLGHIVEMVCGMKRLDRLALKSIFQPLGMESSGYIDFVWSKSRGIEAVTDVIVPTAECPWRGKVICGEVHDENAWAMGGVAGHAGLFSTAQDLHLFASEMIRCYHGIGTLVTKETVREFWNVNTAVPGSTWALGWDSPSQVGSSAGKYFSSKAVGHLGFTGCSMWIEPEKELEVILLSNRIHPLVENNGIKDFRPILHDAVMEALGLGSSDRA